MPSFRAGQRLPASHLNAFTSLSANVSGGPTSGANELLLSGSLVVPAAPIDRLVVASFNLFWNFGGTAGARYAFRVRQGGASGAIRCHAIKTFPDANTDGVNGRGRPFLLAANTPLTLVLTVQRSAGAGSAGTGGGQDLNGIAVEFYAAP